MDYKVQLERALDAAHAAAALLRSEFHRPGGPRGTTHHADVDIEAERAIHEVLTGSFPDYGYHGEELGRTHPPADVGNHLWLIDPNDGTAAFMHGFRGAAISIALLRDGRPVLGVIHAYCAPDDSGDLFVWAEGCGPLRRNGVAVQRAWPSRPTSKHTALVSHHADQKSLLNAQLLAPLRFRGIPGIAYRLALVAAGEGDLAISLNNACGWDYAAGHALLLGSGAELYDKHARPVTYSRNGESTCHGACFGGPESFVQDFSKRDWSSIFRAQRESDSFCWPVTGRSVSDIGMLARAQGCLLGQLAGDSLGSLVEFESADSIKKKNSDGPRLLADSGTWSTIAGQPTDDSEMALALARSIVRAEGYDVESAAQAYVGWMQSGPFDSGSTTRTALNGAKLTTHSVAESLRRAASQTSQANGALMRVSPLGILGATASMKTVCDCARADAALTHPHPVCQDANELFVAAIGYAISSGATPVEIHEHALQLAVDLDLHTAVSERLRLAKDEPPADFQSQQGWVLIAFQNAFYQLLHADSLEAGVVNTVRCGGDTDTNAAIAGALLGAAFGRVGIPTQWLDRILTCRPAATLEGVRRPRPKQFWPVDALWLAERLLLAGQ